MNRSPSNDENKNDELDQLIELYGNSLNGKLWRGSQSSKQQFRGAKSEHNSQVISTGYNELDEQLHGKGWPLATSTELCLSQAGIGELRLLTPALRQLQGPLDERINSPERTNSPERIKGPELIKSHGNIILVAPPFLPFAPALLKEQIDINRMTVVQTNSMQDTLWAAEQALLAECCAAVICWTGNHNLSTRELRRLQLAAEKSNTWNVLFRHSDCIKQPSSSGLRIHLKSNTYSQLDIHILKQPSGWGGQQCKLSLQPHYENWQRLPAHLLPHQNQLQTPILREPLNDSANTDYRQASVTVLTSLAALKVAH